VSPVLAGFIDIVRTHAAALDVERRADSARRARRR
jgi:hypothetical protein